MASKGRATGTKGPEVIDVEKIVKVMSADLPANFDKAILASELGKAKSWYVARSGLNKWPKREKIVGSFIKDTERYRAALEAYSEASQNIPLPFRLPSWLNIEALDDVVAEAKACLQPLGGCIGQWASVLILRAAARS